MAAIIAVSETTFSFTVRVMQEERWAPVCEGEEKEGNIRDELEMKSKLMIEIVSVQSLPKSIMYFVQRTSTDCHEFGFVFFLGES